MDALNELLAAVRKVDATAMNALEPTDLSKDRPTYLPEFARLIKDLSIWRDAVEDQATTLLGEAQRVFTLSDEKIDLDVFIRDEAPALGLTATEIAALEGLRKGEAMVLRDRSEAEGRLVLSRGR